MRDFILNPVVRRLLDHPLEDRFTHAEFIVALEEVGFSIVGEQVLARSFGWYVADKPA